MEAGAADLVIVSRAVLTPALESRLNHIEERGLWDAQYARFGLLTGAVPAEEVEHRPTSDFTGRPLRPAVLLDGLPKALKAYR